MKALGIVASLAALLMGAVPAAAQDSYPSRPVRIVVAYAPGGSTDLIARILAIEMTTKLGQSVFVENKGGGGTVVGTQFVAKSEPDGYTLFYGTPAMVNTLVLHDKPPYELEDFAPISLATVQTLGVFTSVRFPPKTVQELIAYAKANPGKVNFASSGNNSAQHLTGVAFGKAAGVEMLHIPYRGAGPALTDLLAGQVDLMFTSMFGVMDHVKKGDLRLIATTGLTRAAGAQEYPTVHESGLPSFEAISWQGLLAPAKTPQPVLDRLAAVMQELGASAPLAAKLAAQGMDLRGAGPAELKAAMLKEYEAAKAAAKAGTKID